MENKERYVVNLFIDGEEEFIEVDPRNICKGLDKQGEHVVLDITQESLDFDPRVDYAQLTNRWFASKGLSFEDFQAFCEQVFKLEFEEDY